MSNLGRLAASFQRTALSASPSDAITALISPACASVKLADLVPADAMVTAAAKLQEIRKRAVVNEEERGLETLFLALGIASWPAPHRSPVHRRKLLVSEDGHRADLRDLLEALVRHDIVAAMAKEPGASAALRSAGTDVELPELDSVPPDQEFLVLDADSTQQRAVGHALIGRNGVISGPPGTGKSQTIAKLICEFAARGKKVLFVAEKRAALEAVLKRLEKKGLAHLCLDLHGAEVSRRQVLERVAVALEKIRDAQRVDPAAVHQRFVERRTRLNEHARRLHVTRHPSGLSIFQLQGRLLRLADTSCPVRWRRDALKEMTPDRRRQIIALLEEAAGFPGLFARRDPGPWTHAVVVTLPPELLEDVLKAEEVRTRWEGAAGAGSAPRAWAGDITALQSSMAVLAGAVADLSRVLSGAGGLTMTVDRLREWTQALAADTLSPFRVARIRQITGELRRLGAGEFVDGVEAAFRRAAAMADTEASTPPAQISTVAARRP